MKTCSFASIVVALILAVPLCNGATIDFEQFTDSEILTTQIPGLTFSNTIVLTAGISLNQLESPPRSGSNVAADNGAPVGISFASPVTSFSGYFTYTVPVTLSAFGSNDQDLASAHSLFSKNLALSGNPGSSPNEFLQISSTLGITRVEIAGAPSGGSFVMDDISFSNISTVPEPLSVGLLLFGFAALSGVRKHRA